MSRLDIEFDENDTPLCPLIHGVSEWDEDGETRVIGQQPCHAELRLIVLLCINPGQGDPIVWRDDMTIKNATTSAWEFKCDNGHVLATSCEEEDAEDFTWLKDRMLERGGCS